MLNTTAGVISSKTAADDEEEASRVLVKQGNAFDERKKSVPNHKSTTVREKERHMSSVNVSFIGHVQQSDDLQKNIIADFNTYGMRSGVGFNNGYLDSSGNYVQT